MKQQNQPAKNYAPPVLPSGIGGGITNFLNDCLAGPIGSMSCFKFGIISREVEKIEENTFEIHDTSNGWTSAVVCGDTLINLLTGREYLTNIIFR